MNISHLSTRQRMAIAAMWRWHQCRMPAEMAWDYSALLFVRDVAAHRAYLTTTYGMVV